MTVGERIKAERIRQGLSQEELAAKAGYSDKTAISKLEHAANNITMKQIKRIATALDVETSYLLGWESETHGMDLRIYNDNADFLIENTKILSKSLKMPSYMNTLFQNEALQKLVEIASKCDKEDLEMLIKMLERFKGGEKHEETE